MRVIATFQLRAAFLARKPSLGENDDLVGVVVQQATQATEAGIRPYLRCAL